MNAHLVDPGRAQILDVMGATIQYLTPPEAGDGEPCIMLGTIPPSVVVPLHRHADPETFLARSGALEGLVTSGDGFSWIAIRPGEVFHVPGGAKHAFRNPGYEPAEMIIVSTATIGAFFRELGSPVRTADASRWPPSQAAVEHFLEVAARYGYWNATPEENAAVGIHLG